MRRWSTPSPATRRYCGCAAVPANAFDTVSVPLDGQTVDLTQAFDLFRQPDDRLQARIAQGRTNREIAEELFLGEETVKSHLSRLYAKLDATDRRDAVARALAVGLLG